jgi:hypothetical protein
VLAILRNNGRTSEGRTRTSITEKADARIGLLHDLFVNTMVYNKISRGAFHFLPSLSHNVSVFQLIFDYLTVAPAYVLTNIILTPMKDASEDCGNVLNPGQAWRKSHRPHVAR